MIGCIIKMACLPCACASAAAAEHSKRKHAERYSHDVGRLCNQAKECASEWPAWSASSRKSARFDRTVHCIGSDKRKGSFHLYGKIDSKTNEAMWVEVSTKRILAEGVNVNETLSLNQSLLKQAVRDESSSSAPIDICWGELHVSENGTTMIKGRFHSSDGTNGSTTRTLITMATDVIHAIPENEFQHPAVSLPVLVNSEPKRLPAVTGFESQHPALSQPTAVQRELAKRNEGYGEGECSICLNDVERADRKGMPCDERHWLCGTCLDAMAESARAHGLSAVTCPYCRAEAPLDAPPAAAAGSL